MCMCSEHVRALLDRCPGCGSTIHPKRPRTGTEAWKIDRTGLALCGWCGMDLRSATPPKLPYGITGPAMVAQKKLFSVLKWGTDFLKPYRDVMSEDYVRATLRAVRKTASMVRRDGDRGISHFREPVEARAIALATLTFD